MEQAGCVFPEKLIKKCQKLIFEKSGKKISKNEAEIYLDKFGQLMKSVIKIMDQPKKKKTKQKKSLK